MGLNIYIFIPSTFVGWKYCLKNPKSFFSSFSDRSIEKKHIQGLISATMYAKECASQANITCNKLYDENFALRKRVESLEKKLKEKTSTV